MKNKNILIIGCGLISGSLFKGLYEDNNIDVVEIDADTKFILEHKYKVNVYNNVDNLELDHYDLIISGLFPLKNIELITTNLQKFRNSKMIDVAGIQSIWNEHINTLVENDIQYICTHPMSGKEISGFLSADEELFDNKKIIINNLSASKEFLKQVESMYKYFGAYCVDWIDPITHDKVVTLTSQLPHILSVCYTKLIEDKYIEEVKLISANSFRDFSRISNINIGLWSQVFIENKDEILRHMKLMDNNLQSLYKIISEENDEDLVKFLTQSKEKIKKVTKKT